jgi:division protein CdvB (Snf7/Vps24/ESCRT-III family)
MDKVSSTLASLDEVKKQINDSRILMEKKHKDLFRQCVRAQQAKESAFSAVIYAFKCAQARKTSHLLLASQVELEQVVLRAETADDFCQTVAKLTPIIQKVTDNLAKATPDASQQLEEIGETLDALVGELRKALDHSAAAASAGGDRGNPLVDSRTPDDPVWDGLPFSADDVSLARAETQGAPRASPLGAGGKSLSTQHLMSPQPVTKFFYNTSEKLRRLFHTR